MALHFQIDCDSSKPPLRRAVSDAIRDNSDSRGLRRKILIGPGAIPGQRSQGGVQFPTGGRRFLRGTAQTMQARERLACGSDIHVDGGWRASRFGAAAGFLPFAHSEADGQGSGPLFVVRRPIVRMKEQRKI